VPDPSSPFSLARLAKDTLALMDELGLGKVHILGNSAGGYVGQRLAIDNPERVKSLVLYGSTPGLTRSQVSTWVPHMGAIGIRPFLAETISDRFPVDAVDPRFVEWFLDEAANNDLPFIQRFVGHMSTVDMMEEIRAIRCPVLMIAPGAEPVGHASTYEDMKVRIPDNDLVYYDGARHNISDYLPDRCAADTLAWLQRRFPRG
jgi:pimeloyl-ACP methyl ester carboxylesterase